MADNSILQRLDGLKLKYEELGQKLTDPEVIADVKQFVQLNKDYKELEPIIETSERFRTALANLAKVSRSISSVRCRTSIRNPHFLFSSPPLARRSRSPCRVCGKYSTPALSKGESFCLGTNKISRSCYRSSDFPAGKPVS